MSEITAHTQEIVRLIESGQASVPGYKFEDVKNLIADDVFKNHKIENYLDKLVADNDTAWRAEIDQCIGNGASNEEKVVNALLESIRSKLDTDLTKLIHSLVNELVQTKRTEAGAKLNSLVSVAVEQFQSSIGGVTAQTSMQQDPRNQAATSSAQFPSTNQYNDSVQAIPPSSDYQDYQSQYQSQWYYQNSYPGGQEYAPDQPKQSQYNQHPGQHSQHNDYNSGRYQQKDYNGDYKG